jgi:guanosine-3',5'-bis(diphosphate) 3'-pyrophosphohydrolase
MELQDDYQKAISFAGKKHSDQLLPGSDISYMVHLSNVAMEIILANEHSPNFDRHFAVQVALLHDLLEDTSTTFEEIESAFGINIARAVLALTKNDQIPPVQQIPDSLNRIKSQPKEVWAVKLADRISNMQKPPQHWDANKIVDYKKTAGIILLQLRGGNQYLENRLHQKIIEYNQFISAV